ncbi:MAG: FadR/GntR family transcriptional regulator, partial [Streptosporangiaceae bacterium]
YVQIANNLIEAIETGRYPVGSYLPTEQQLAARFGVSRPSIREALSCLHFEGYVAPRQGRRTVVTSADARSASRNLERLPADVSFTQADLFEARLTLEPEVLAIAAAEPDPAALPAVRQILAGMKLALSEPDLRPRTDFEVHATLVRVCRNSLLVHATERLLHSGENDPARRTREQIWHERSLPWKWLEHHEAMARAVMSHDPRRAAEACRLHLASVMTGIADSPGTDEVERTRLRSLIARAGRGPEDTN